MNTGTACGMVGSALRRESLVVRGPDRNECDARQSHSTRFVVVLSPDAVFAGDLETHLHRTGYAVRVASTVSEICAVTDPTSLLLVLVDHRSQDWELLRTDPSLRHVLLIAVVPFGCLYTEERCISDLERGLDGVHDLRDGHRLMVAKVAAYLRRADGENLHRGVYRVGAVELDRDAHEVRVAGRQVKLSAKPFAILTVLMRAPSRVFSRIELVNRVWGPDYAVGGHALDVHVHALRQQLAREPDRLCELVTVNRVGFTLKPISSTGAIRTRRGRAISNLLSGSHTNSAGTPRLTPSFGRVIRFAPPSDPPLKSPTAVGMPSA
jgi:DNA-binding response OmpR family regulator